MPRGHIDGWGGLRKTLVRPFHALACSAHFGCIRGHWSGGPCPCQALPSLARAKLLKTFPSAMPTPRATFGTLGHGAQGLGRNLGAASEALPWRSLPLPGSAKSGPSQNFKNMSPRQCAWLLTLDMGGGTNRCGMGLNLSGSWQQGHSATYNTPPRI